MTSLEQVLSNPLVAQVLGLVVGLLTSFFSWWVLFHWIAPVLSLSPYISKTTDKSLPEDAADASGVRYRLKYINIGRRAIVDLEIRAFIRIKGLDQAISWTVFDLRMNSDGDRINSFARIDPFRKSKIRHLVRLYPNGIINCTRHPFPDHIRSKARERALLLEDLLSLGTAAELCVIASGYDEFSGARKVQQFVYRHSDVRAGPFRNHSLEVEKEPSPHSKA